MAALKRRRDQYDSALHLEMPPSTVVKTDDFNTTGVQKYKAAARPRFVESNVPLIRRGARHAPPGGGALYPAVIGDVDGSIPQKKVRT
jgi:hypothetical protein